MEKVFNYVSKQHKTVAFEGDQTFYKVSPQVLKWATSPKAGFKKGDTVEVTMEGDTVVKITKGTGSSKPTTPLTTTSSPASSSGDTYTILGFPQNKQVVKFAENKEKWFDVSQELQEKDWTVLGISAKKVVKVIFSDIDGNKTVTSMIPIESNSQAPASESGVKHPARTSNPYETGKNESIERQCAWKTAGEVVSKIFDAQVGINDIELVRKVMQQLAEDGIRFITKQ